MSTVSRIPATAPSSVRKVIVASLIGTSLEWYDFFIYGTAAALVFNKIFFRVVRRGFGRAEVRVGVKDRPEADRVAAEGP